MNNDRDYILKCEIENEISTEEIFYGMEKGIINYIYLGNFLEKYEKIKIEKIEFFGYTKDVEKITNIKIKENKKLYKIKIYYLDEKKGRKTSNSFISTKQNLFEFLKNLEVIMEKCILLVIYKTNLKLL